MEDRYSRVQSECQIYAVSMGVIGAKRLIPLLAQDNQLGASPHHNNDAGAPLPEFAPLPTRFTSIVGFRPTGWSGTSLRLPFGFVAA